jgi:glutamyl-tRNA synthetase
MSGTLQHDGSAAGVVAALSLVGLREVAVHERPGEAVLTLDGVETKGAEEILRVLARRFPERGLLGSGLGAAAVEEAAARVFSADQLEAHVALRTFVAGHAVTLADLLHLSVPAGGPHSRRWRRQVEYVCGLQAARKEAVVSGAVNFGSQGSFDKMRLDDAVLDKVVVRFPPEPSGYLHIGHGKVGAVVGCCLCSLFISFPQAVLLNDYYRTLYKGQMIVRFDDTNPAKEKTEFADAILEDLARLGIKPDRVTHTSDNFAYILGKAKQLIAQGDAYVDDQEKETIRTQRFNKEDGPARNLPVATHLERWEAMLAGAEYGRKCVLRARISMQHDNR